MRKGAQCSKGEDSMQMRVLYVLLLSMLVLAGNTGSVPNDIF
jgi:hypothetical protein